MFWGKLTFEMLWDSELKEYNQLLILVKAQSTFFANHYDTWFENTKGVAEVLRN